ncbi:MAG: hypothetical protein MJ228_00635 [Bacilli bacterium]|nr:hypothetical protein [Bacilli bacterium]
MKQISKEVLVDAANRLLFTMSDEQYETLDQEFKTLTKLMGKIGEIEGLENYEPMTFPFNAETDFLREDEPQEILPRDVALKNAGSKQDDQVKLPKVVL